MPRSPPVGRHAPPSIPNIPASASGHITNSPVRFICVTSVSQFPTICRSPQSPDRYFHPNPVSSLQYVYPVFQGAPKLTQQTSASTATGIAHAATSDIDPTARFQFHRK